MYVSCGTYQYSGYINDGIYENSDDVYAENEENKPNKNIPNDYYKNYFDEVSTSYSNLNNDLFTDTDEYVTSERDSVQSKYGPWGSNINSVEINIHSNYNDSFWTRWHYPNWMWNYGYGYGNVWGWGYNNYWSRPYPYFNGFMIRLILFGVITTHSIMDMVMAAIHTGIHHIGDHIITGTMVISTEVIITTIIHSLVQEEVHRHFPQEIVLLTVT